MIDLAMKNILFIESGVYGGGSFESLYHLLKGINKNKFNPIVIFLNHTRFNSKIESLGIKVYTVFDVYYSRKTPVILKNMIGEISLFISKHLCFLSLQLVKCIHFLSIRAIMRIVQENDIDLIYLNGQINRDLFGVMVAKEKSLPCISHLRSMDSRGFNPTKAKFANKYVAAFISNSISTKLYWEGQGIQSNKNSVIYNALPTEIVQKYDIWKKWGINSEVKFVIGCVGRLIPLKGHVFLLHSFKKILESYPDLVLMIIGDGPLKQELISETIQLKIEPNVLFTGYIHNALSVIASLDLMVLPSRYEAFGRVILEAMVQKVPVIGTNLYGIKEIIEHGENGFLIDFGDDISLCKYIEKIMTDSNLRNKMIANGQKTVQDKFNIAQYSQQIENIISNQI